MKNVVFILASITALMLVGCGGGSSSQTETTSVSTPVDNTPSVNGYPAIPQIPADN